MLHACAARFDVTKNLKNFLIFSVKPQATENCILAVAEGPKQSGVSGRLTGTRGVVGGGGVASPVRAQSVSFSTGPAFSPLRTQSSCFHLSASVLSTL